MTDKEKIRAEIKRRLKALQGSVTDYARGERKELEKLLSFIDSLQKEPVSDTQSPVIFYGLTGSVGNTKEEPVSEELEKAANEYADKHGFRVPYDGSNNFYDEVDVKASKEGFIAGTNWQKEKEYTCYEEAFEDGAKWQITKLMKDATEVTVHIDAGNYPYIPQIELYDYDKDIPLAKEGDKYKVILIKE